jgi:predicted nucleic acid-binding protein
MADRPLPPMDVNRLPSRVLLDTGVFIRALGEHSSDPRSADCREFTETMLKAGRDLLVAAPSMAEMIRGMPVPTPPTTPGFIIVPFDDMAAIVLGTQFPAKVLKEVAGTSGTPLTYLKYDAMIAACAIRHKAQFLVTLDHRLGAQTPSGLKIAAPGDFRTKQLTLLAEPPPSGKAKTKP